MADPTFEEIAAALYAGPPEDFVGARNAQAKGVGDVAAAKRIRALRKPSVAAWVVNVFAQERADQLGQALQLAAELREAQEDLDARALAKLGRERRMLTRRLAEMAADLAESRGEKVTPATRDAVEQTISAAFFDPDAAAAVATGRLVRGLEPTATADEVRDAVVGEVPALAPAAEAPADELAARRARRDAERRVVEAEKRVAAAERELSKRESALRALREKADELAARRAALEKELAHVRAEEKDAGARMPDAEKSRTQADETEAEAREALDEARKARDEL